MALRGNAVLSLGCVALLTACAADDSDVSGGGGTAGFGGVVSGGAGGASGGSGGATSGSGGASGGTGGASGGSGGSAGASGGSAGASGGSGGATGGSGGATGGSGGATGGSGGASGGSGGATGGSGGATGGTGGATGGTGGTTGDTTPPTVSSTSPTPTSTGVQKGASVAVTFSEAMQLTSITTSTSGTSCTGSIQVSADNFATCVAMTGQPVASSANSVFTVTPSGSLASLGAYKVRVTTAAKDASGNALASVFTTNAAFTVRYFHTITIDGVNDFAANETFATSSTGYTGYVAWDEGYLYVGMSGADVASNSATKWLALYFSGSPGTTTGVGYATQQPTLPFSARWHARWRTNNGYTNTQVWSGSAWGDAGWNFTGDVYQTGNFVEMRVPLVDIGSPTTLSLHMGMLNEQTAAEGTYAAVPSTSYTDGYDPNYAKYLELALGASVAPNASPIKP